MTASTEIRPRGSFNPPAPRAANISQATAIEQSRAIAEVQASVVVAQSCPRDMNEAEREMEYVCGRLDMAEQAFYQVTNRGTGMSVHLARELARIWGNVDYGVKELHRDDEKAISEVQAFAWDIQKNTRSSRSFINPHQKMATRDGVKQRINLDDLQDIYLSNQNIGARAVRECIQTILPRWFTEKAQNLCHQTLEHGEGKPLQARIAALIKAFEGLGVTEKQLAARLDKPSDAWTPEDLAQLTIAGQSIRRGEAQRDELFPPLTAKSSTADEIAPAATEKQTADKPKRRTVTAARKKLDGAMFDLLDEVGLNADRERDNRLIIQARLAGRNEPITSSADLTDVEVQNVIDTIKALNQEGDEVFAEWVTNTLNAATVAEDNEPEPAAEPAAEPAQEQLPTDGTVQ